MKEARSNTQPGNAAEVGVSSFGRILIALSDTVDRSTTFLAVIGTVAFAAVMLLGVFFRYVLNASLSWSDEVALIIFGWVAFLFIASAYLHDRHVNVDILIRNLSGRWKTGAAIAAEGLAAGYLLALLVSSIQAMNVMASGHTDVLRIPVSGKLMYTAGIARLLVNFAQVLVGRVRGGLGASNVVASFIFGDISGSSVSGTAAIGTIMIPQMKQRGYCSARAVVAAGVARCVRYLSLRERFVLAFARHRLRDSGVRPPDLAHCPAE